MRRGKRLTSTVESRKGEGKRGGSQDAVLGAELGRSGAAPVQHLGKASDWRQDATAGPSKPRPYEPGGIGSTKKGLCDVVKDGMRGLGAGGAGFGLNGEAGAHYGADRVFGD